MTRGVALYLVGSLVLGALLVGCGRIYVAQREPWRHEAEVACLKSGAVKDSPVQVRIDPIEGPGVCGADFPLKVAALGDNSAIGFAEEPRPPAAIPGASVPPQPSRWPIIEPRHAPPPAAVRPVPGAEGGPGAPISLAPPGLESSASAPLRYEPDRVGVPAYPQRPAPASTLRYPASQPIDDDIPDDAILPDRSRAGAPRAAPARPPATNLPLGTRSPAVTGSIVPAAVTPPATLACPIVSALDQWVAAAVQPAAARWFGQPVVEIKQISAYSCRGMNGNSRAHISEHAFGNALDISAFVLADGRKVTVKDGWKGSPEEQGFLHDVQLAACEQFTTVLAPGSNRFHYDHIHVDLMRRASGRIVCEPDAIPGAVAAARAQGRGTYVRRGDPAFTGSIARQTAKRTLPETKTPEPVMSDDLDDESVLEDAAPHAGSIVDFRNTPNNP
jgi:hypothetical protein